MRLLLPFFPLLFILSASASRIGPYTFLSSPALGSDGFQWPNILLDGDYLYAEEWPYMGVLTIGNYLNNPLFFDGNYLATGNSPRIQGPAMWGNPRRGFPFSDPELEIDLFAVFDGADVVSAISFDFAWATSQGSPASPPPLQTLPLMICDYGGNCAFLNVSLPETFTHSIGGSGIGRTGRVTLSASDIGLEDLAYLKIFFEEATFPGHVTEFAIDNFALFLDGQDPGPGPGTGGLVVVDWSGEERSIYWTNALKGTGIFGISDNVMNTGSQPTTYSAVWEGSHPDFFDPDPASRLGVSISPNETIYDALRWSINTDTALSGSYSGTWRVYDDGDAGADPFVVEVGGFELYDPPVLAANNSGVIQVPGGGPVTLGNAAAGPHAGARRASVTVTGIRSGNTRLSINGFSVGDRLNAGEILSGTPVWQTAGLPAGVHSAQLTVSLQMSSPLRSFLNRRQPVPDQIWTVSVEVPATGSSQKTLQAGESFASDELTISSPSTGVRLPGGISSTSQTVTLGFTAVPPDAPGLFVNEPFDLNFGVPGDLHVLEIAYRGEDLMPGFREIDLRLFTYDPATEEWLPSVALNSDGGPPAGSRPFAGSFADYLATKEGGELTADDLGMFGVDAVGKTAWAVLDHASVFRLGYGNSTLPPQIVSIQHDPVALVTTILYQSIEGRSFGVRGSADLATFEDLPDTEPGDGSVMTYTHAHTGPVSRYFFTMRQLE